MNNLSPPNMGSANNCALASLILSSALVILGPLGSIPGIICGHLAMKEYKAAGVKEGRGMAKAGIIIGWIGLALALLSLVAFFIWMRNMNQIFDSIRDLPSQ